MAQKRDAIYKGLLVTDSANTDPQQMEAVVWLQYPRNKSNNERIGDMCSGVAIADNVIMTAAHCLDDNHYPNGLEPGEHRRIVFDRLQIQDRTVGERHADGVEVDAYVNPHWNYSINEPTADIAVLCWNPSSPYSPNAATLVKALDTAKIFMDSMYTGMRLDIYGWGYTRNDGTGRGKLRKGQDNNMVRVDELHSSWFRGSSSKARICNIDSGGGIFRWVGNYEAVLGIASSSKRDSPGDTCAGNDQPQRFTRVNFRVDWIEQVTGIQCNTVSPGGVSMLDCDPTSPEAL